MTVFTVVRNRVLIGNFTQRKYVFETINKLDATIIDQLEVYDEINKQRLTLNYHNLCKCFRNKDVVEIMVKQGNVYKGYYSIWQTEMNTPRSDQTLQIAEQNAINRIENHEEETKDQDTI